MFDLFRSRDKVARYVMGGLLMLVALSMVTYLIPGGYGSGGGSQQNPVIAEIGKETLTVQDVRKQMQALERSQRFPANMAGYFVDQVIDDMISSRALIYQAKRMGLDVDDAEVARGLRAAFPQFFPNGQFIGKEAYAAFLAQQGMTVPEFEAQFRQQLMIMRLGSLVGDSVVVTPKDVEQEYRRRNDKVKVEYIAFSPEKLRQTINITPDAIRTFFEKSRGEFKTPELRSFDLIVGDQAKFGEKINLSDDELKKAYEQNKESFRVPERVHVRHILLKFSDKSKEKEEAPRLQAQAEDLVKQLKGGGDFAALATKFSGDPGSKDKGGDLSWIVRGQTVPAFESAAFSLQPNQISGVIRTEYGFHILQVLEKETAHVRTFEEVKPQLADERKRQMVNEGMQKAIEQAHDELVKKPAQAAEIANRLNLAMVHVDKVEKGQPVPVFGNNPDFSESIASLARGGVTQVMQASADKLAVAVVTDVTPSRPAQLQEVEAQIRERLISQQLQDLIVRKSDEAAAKAKAAGGDMKKAAQEMGLELKTTQEFGLDGAADGIGPATSLRPAFDQAVGTVFGPVSIGEQRFVCKVISKTPADISKLDTAMRESLRSDLKQAKGKERSDLFMDSVRSGLVREGKIKIHQDVRTQVISSYRS